FRRRARRGLPSRPRSSRRPEWIRGRGSPCSRDLPDGRLRAGRLGDDVVRCLGTRSKKVERAPGARSRSAGEGGFRRDGGCRGDGVSRQGELVGAGSVAHHTWTAPGEAPHGRGGPRRAGGREERPAAPSGAVRAAPRAIAPAPATTAVAGAATASEAEAAA